jgi:predicted ATPase
MFEEMLGSLHYLGPLREYPARQYPWAGSEPADMGRRGEAAIAALLSAQRRGPEISMGRGVRRRTLEEHVAHWLRQFGLIEYFHVEEIAPGSNLYRVKVRKSVTSAEVLLTDVGFGVSQVLPVLVLLFYAPEGSIVILEQPELHLHPSVQAGLADVLIDATERRGIQLIVKSHSEHFLLRLQRRVAEGRLEAKKAALYFCDRAPDGQSKLTELDLDLLGNIRNWPKDFFGDSFGEREAMVRAGLKRRRETAA